MSNEEQIPTTEKKDQRKARIATGIYVLALLLFIIIFGFKKPYPPYEEEGIFVNFGLTETGFGEIEPVKQEKPVVKEVIEQPVAETIEEVHEEVETQDIEETVAIPKPKKEQPKKPKPKKEPEPVKEVKTEEPVVKETPKEPEPEVNQEALFNPSTSNSKGTNEGQSSNTGNQGDPGGVENAPNYEGINKGLGNKGFGWSLSGRSLKSRPNITDDSQKEGTVAIKIKVDKSGKVISAEYTLKGSTTSDSDLVKKAIKAAYTAEFNSDTNAAEVQQGTFTFVFKLK